MQLFQTCTMCWTVTSAFISHMAKATTGKFQCIPAAFYLFQMPTCIQAIVYSCGRPSVLENYFRIRLESIKHPLPFKLTTSQYQMEYRRTNEAA